MAEKHPGEEKPDGSRNALWQHATSRPAVCVALHPQKPWLCACLENGVIQLWDHETTDRSHSTIAEWKTPEESGICCVDFHPRQPILATGDKAGHVTIWDCQEQTQALSLEGHTGRVNSVQFHPTRENTPSMIVSASHDGSVRLWDHDAGVCLSVLRRDGDPAFTSAKFCPDETAHLLVSSSADKMVYVWCLQWLVSSLEQNGGQLPPPSCFQRFMRADETNGVRLKFAFTGHLSSVTSARFHPTLPLLVSGDRGGVVKIWRMTETKAWEVDQLLGHTEEGVADCLYHPTKDSIVSIGSRKDGSTRVWDLSSRKVLKVYNCDNHNCLAAYKGKNLIVGADDAGVTIYEIN